MKKHALLTIYVNTLFQLKTKDKLNIAISGFSGTGKTTLIKKLAEKLNKHNIDTLIIPSYSSEFIRDYQFKNNCEKQKALYEFAKKYQKEMVIGLEYNIALFDRSILDILAYNEYFCPELNTKSIKEFKLYDVIYLIEMSNVWYRNIYFKHIFKYKRLFPSLQTFLEAKNKYYSFWVNIPNVYNIKIAQW